MKTNIEYLDISKVGNQNFTVVHRNLKPCPFCGNKEPCIKVDSQRTWNNSCYSGEIFTDINRVVKVFCTRCPANITVTNSRKGSKTEPWEAWLVKDAVKFWNKRVKNK